jgi:hypothetical protein
MDEINYPPEARPVAPGKGFAIASLVLGLVGLLIPLLGVLAIIFGGVALNQMKYGTGEGKGMAIWGIVLGIVEIAGCIICYVMYFIIYMGGALAG